MRPAFSNVPGFPAATHNGGWGWVYGFGRMLRGGIEKNRPSNEYDVDRHILGSSTMTSSNISLVSSGSGIPKPCCSVVDEPRPIPNSNRPSERWSSMATRSATRAGGLTGGVMLKMPEPRWIRLVRAATKARNDSLADRWE